MYAGYDARTNPNQVQAGMLGGVWGLVAYNVFKSVQHFHLLRLSPMSCLAVGMFYGLYTDDKAVLGGIAAGYSAFFFAL